MSRRDKFVKVLNKHGYNSLNAFCLDNKLQQSNFNKRLKDEDLKVDILILFKLANLLHEPIDVMIEIFYPEEMKENKSLIEK